MPIGLKFQREHRFLGYKIKYFYYFLRRRDILQTRKNFGTMNPNETVYLIKPDYQDGVEGLLSLINKQVLYIEKAKKHGYIPYVDWKNYKTQYYDGKNNAWEFFFKQPSNLTEAEVYNSKNVYLSGWTFQNINSENLFESDIFFDKEIRRKSSDLLRNNLQFNEEVEELLRKEKQKLNIEECLGIYIRGTDYIKLKPSGEYIQPSVEQMKNKISDFLNKYDVPIFLVTEDGNIYDTLKDEFGDKIRTVSYDTFIRDYDGKDVLSKSNILEENKKLRGQKYLVKMILLSKCKYLITSITQGSKFSYALNDGKYIDEYVFNLGLYS